MKYEQLDEYNETPFDFGYQLPMNYKTPHGESQTFPLKLKYDFSTDE